MIDLKELSDNLSKLTITEAVELVHSLEKKWGISHQNIASSENKNNDESKKEPEKTEFDVVLKSVGPKKIQVIKAIREITELNLKEAKAIADAAPKVVKAKLSKSESDSIKSKLEKLGAEISIK
jgi:large subunit ribosomal protein L7/L12